LNIKISAKLKRVGKFFLPFFLSCFIFPFSLYAFFATSVPGNLKDINATSKAWLSSKEFPVIFYSKDTNLSLSFKSSLKLLTNMHDIAILLTVKKSDFFDKKLSSSDLNNSFVFSGRFSEYNLTAITTSSITHISLKKEHTVKNIHKTAYTDNNISILQQSNTIISNKLLKYGYITNNFLKSPLANDKNSTANIGTNQNNIYITKSLDDNKTFVNISFKIVFNDNNTTTIYQTKWFNIQLIPSKTDLLTPVNSFSSSYDIKNGKNIFLQNCIACHRYNQDKTAPKGIAPILTNVGGWANKEYIKDILLHPEDYKTKRYKRLENSGKIMAMPSYEWLEKKDFNDLLCFLENLKAKDEDKSPLNTQNYDTNSSAISGNMENMDKNITFNDFNATDK
jgi:mono/diheme cytochrome c family protein